MPKIKDLVICVLFGLCVFIFFINKSNVDKINALEFENKALSIENEILNRKYDEACQGLRDKQLHHVIGYYSIKPNSKIDRDTLYSFLNRHRDVFHFPDIIYAQVVLESGVGNSSLYGRSNNLVGMGYATSRETTATGKTDGGFATYKNWQMCVLDRPLWDNMMFKNRKPTRAEYIAKLKQSYATDPKYIDRINHIILTDYNKRCRKNRL